MQCSGRKFSSTTEKYIFVKIPGENSMQARKPNRLKYYDYSNAGWYYVTICTKDHKVHFGIVEKDKMISNNCGKSSRRIVAKYSKALPLCGIGQIYCYAESYPWNNYY